MKTFRKYLTESAKKLTEGKYYIKRETGVDHGNYFGEVGGAPVWGDKHEAFAFDDEDKAKKFYKKYDFLFDKEKRPVQIIKEAKLDYGNRYEFDTIGGKPEVSIIGNEVHMGCWSSGAKVFTSDEFQKKLDAAGERGEYYKAVQEVQDAINKELLKAMNRFDNDMKAVLKKYGFK